MESTFAHVLVGWDQMQAFVATDAGMQNLHGPSVLAVEMSSADYDKRYAELAKRHCMKEPRSYQGARSGFLVVRKAGTCDAYETWMARHMLLRSYRPAAWLRDTI